MFDEWLVSRLSKNAWALLGALLLLRRQESTFSNAELSARAAISKASVVSAKQELVLKGLVTVTEVRGQPSVIRLNIQSEGFADEQDQGVAKEIGGVARPQAPQIQAPDILGVVMAKFNAVFPDSMIDRIALRRMLVEAHGNEARLSYAVDATIEKQPRYPKAYMLSICKQTPINEDDNGTLQPPPPELVALTERAREHAKGQHVRSIEDRRKSTKGAGH